MTDQQANRIIDLLESINEQIKGLREIEESVRINSG
jgi:hypothetical protein